MKAFVYYLTVPILYLVSYLPFWLLYIVSDFFFIVIYYLLRYRRKVVLSNLKNCFPYKSKDELNLISKKYYRYFCDLFLESLKSLSISTSQLKKRLQFENIELFKKYWNKNQSIIIVMGHFGNWELGGARFALEPFHKLNVIYHPLKNKYFDGLTYHMRTRLGNGLYAMKETIRCMIRDRKEITATAFIADQTPSPKSAFWFKFLNQDTPFFTGTGKIANKMGYPVIYASIKRFKRGYYKIQLTELIKESKEVSAEKIVESFAQKLESDIKEIPEIWLWSHKRWKHKRNA